MRADSHGLRLQLIAAFGLVDGLQEGAKTEEQLNRDKEGDECGHGIWWDESPYAKSGALSIRGLT